MKMVSNGMSQVPATITLSTISYERILDFFISFFWISKIDLIISNNITQKKNLDSMLICDINVSTTPHFQSITLWGISFEVQF